jgi:hypothetical protein
VQNVESVAQREEGDGKVDSCGVDWLPFRELVWASRGLEYGAKLTTSWRGLWLIYYVVGLNCIQSFAGVEER